MARESVPLKGKKKQDTAGVLPPLISLKCHCCEGYFKEPVTLPCMHSFCRVCLEKYNAQRISKELGERRLERGESEDTDVSNLNNSFSKPGEGKAEEKIPEDYVINVQCPTCIETLKLAPPIEPQVPFENSRLARIVGLVHDSNVVCQNCSEATSEQKCTTCNAWLCVECMELTHSAPIFRTHSKVPLTHSEMMTLPKCDTHPMNDLEFFSTEEEVGVCQVCLLKGDFVGKPYCLVSDVRKARQHEIERGVKVVTDEKERLLAGRQKMELVLDQLKKKLEQQTDAVKANFSLIREALNKREQETLDGLQTLKDAKATVLETQIAQTEHIVGVIDDGVRNVKLVLNHSNDLELVYLTIVLQEFISEMSKIDAPKFKSVDHALEYYHSAAVDADLPVLLSDKVANLVSAYAPVPRPSFVEDTASTGKTGAGEGSSQGGKGVRTAKAPGSSPMKLKVEKPELTKQQKVLLKDVGAEDKGEEYGCVVQ